MLFDSERIRRAAEAMILRGEGLDHCAFESARWVYRTETGPETILAVLDELDRLRGNQREEGS